MAKLSLFDYLSANGKYGFGQPSGAPDAPANEDASYNRFLLDTGQQAGLNMDAYKTWTMSKVPQSYLNELKTARSAGPNTIALGADGQVDVPDQFLNMDDPFFFGSDALNVLGTFGGLVAGGNFLSGGGLNPFSGLGDFGAGATGGGAAFNPLADFGADYFAGSGAYTGGGASGGIGSALNELSALPSPTNLQDLMTKMDSTPAGKSLLNSITGGATDAAGASSILSKILGSGGGAGYDWASILGKLGSTALGMYGSNQQAKSLGDLATQYQNFGAPSRARYEAAMSPGFDPMSIPGYSGALDTANKSMLAQLSAQSGNPFGNPGGLIDAQKKVVSGTALPAIQQYTGQNASVGFGAPMQAALNLQTQGVGADSNVLNALGYGLNAITNPQPSLQDLYKQMSGFKWNEGGGL